MKKIAKHQHKWYGKWHTYAGIIAGFVLLITSLTGSVLVYEAEIDMYLNPSLFPAERSDFPKKNFEAIYTELKSQVAAGDTIHYIYRDIKRNGVYTVMTQNPEQYIVDPYTAKVISKRDYASSFTGFVRELHTTLLVPQIGKYLVGVSALMCFVLMVTGLRLWLPKKLKHLKDRLWVNPKHKAKRVNYDLHNTLGFYFSPFVSIISLTGAMITFNQFLILGLFVINFAMPADLQKVFEPKSEYVVNAKPLTLSAIEEKVKTYKPDGIVMAFDFPHDSAGAFAVDVYEKTPYNAEGHRSRIAVDQYSGAEIYDTDTALPQTSRLYIDWLTALHFGTFGGAVTRVLALIACLVVATLFISGFIIWLPRWKKQKKQPESQQELELAED